MGAEASASLLLREQEKVRVEMHVHYVMRKKGRGGRRMNAQLL
jgi:hypothetical protein